MAVDKQIDFVTSMIRENRIEYHRLRKELKQLLQQFETPEGMNY